MRERPRYRVAPYYRGQYIAERLTRDGRWVDASPDTTTNVGSREKCERYIDRALESWDRQMCTLSENERERLMRMQEEPPYEYPRK